MAKTKIKHMLKNMVTHLVENLIESLTSENVYLFSVSHVKSQRESTRGRRGEKERVKQRTLHKEEKVYGITFSRALP